MMLCDSTRLYRCMTPQLASSTGLFMGNWEPAGAIRAVICCVLLEPSA